jgi:RNA polymerase sigma-70 factor (ECF subfamily)
MQSVIGEQSGSSRFHEFNTLMEVSRRKVFDLALRLSGDRSDAEDLTQEAFIRAYRNFEGYEGGRPFENWIFRIVTRVFLDLLRTRRRRVKYVSYDAPLATAGEESLHFEAVSPRPDPQQELLAGEFSEDLLAAMGLLTDEQRLLVSLADLEEMPYLDIAIRLCTPVGTVRSRLHRAHRRLRDGLVQVRRERQSLVSGGLRRLSASSPKPLCHLSSTRRATSTGAR